MNRHILKNLKQKLSFVDIPGFCQSQQQLSPSHSDRFCLGHGMTEYIELKQAYLPISIWYDCIILNFKA